MKNKILFCLLVSLTSITYAQNSIYKCNINGKITYVNQANLAKGEGCQKTTIGEDSSILIRNETPVVASIANKSVSNKIVNANYSPTPNTAIIQNIEQQKRDASRNFILTQELQEELKQLNNVESMLKNVLNTDDKNQISQLKEMIERHKSNIISLKKELRIKES